METPAVTEASRPKDHDIWQPGFKAVLSHRCSRRVELVTARLTPHLRLHGNVSKLSHSQCSKIESDSANDAGSVWGGLRAVPRLKLHKRAETASRAGRSFYGRW